MTALVLSGGGANGAYEVGVARALVAGCSPATGGEPLRIDVLCGTSTGAFNAAALGSKLHAGPVQAVAALESTWREQVAERPERCGNGVFRLRGDPLPYLDPRCLLSRPLHAMKDLSRDAAELTGLAWRSGQELATTSGPLTERLSGLLEVSALVDVEPLERLIRRNVDRAALGAGPVRMGIAASDWTTGRVRVFENRDLAAADGLTAIRGSTAIPGVFPPVPYRGQQLVDGGLLMNTPLQPAVDAGADRVHIVFLEASIAETAPPVHPDLLSTSVRAFAIIWAQRVRADLERLRVNNRVLIDGPASEPVVAGSALPRRLIEIHAHRPHRPLGSALGMLDFGHQRVHHLIDQGYNDALEHDCARNGCVLTSTTKASAR